MGVMVMKIAIAGGTGFIGKRLTEELLIKGHTIYILTRRPKKETSEKNLFYIQWITNTGDDFLQKVQGIDVFINLAGESLNSGRWTEKRKELILQSRLETTEKVVSLLKSLPQKPRLFLNASAIGYYGTSETAVFTENTKKVGKDFLSETVKQWEEKAYEASLLGIRTIFCRFGIILDKNEGALPKIALPYLFFAGGTLGSGNQWISWMHIDDVINGIIFLMEKESVEGPVNFTSPNPVTMKEFGQTISSVLHRPHWLHVPGFALKLALGEKSMLVLEGQKVLPTRLLESGFSFRFPKLKDALLDIYRK